LAKAAVVMTKAEADCGGWLTDARTLSKNESEGLARERDLTGAV